MRERLAEFLKAAAFQQVLFDSPFWKNVIMLSAHIISETQLKALLKALLDSWLQRWLNSWLQPG